MNRLSGVRDWVTDERAGEKSAPSLIGGFHDNFVGSGLAGLLPTSSCGVPRFEPWAAPDGSICSLDMLRLRLKFGGNDETIAQFEDNLQRLDTLVRSYSMTRSEPGRYAHLHTFEYGDSSVSLGVGQFVRGARADMHRGFIEFNPNKVALGDGLAKFLWLVSGAVYVCELARYDLAVDLPVSRSLVRVAKDRRKYACEMSASMTEYLGQRGTVGYVKVYDKAAELGVSGMPLTRVELTCSGDWSVGQVLDKWPTVYRVADDLSGYESINGAFALSIADAVRAGETPEKYLYGLDWRRRKAVRKLLEGRVFPCPEMGAAHVLAQAMRWCGRVLDGPKRVYLAMGGFLYERG